MNRRQIEKKYKRKWQELFAELYDHLGVRVKPSRVRLQPARLIKGENELRMTARAAGVDFTLCFTPKKEEKNG